MLGDLQRALPGYRVHLASLPQLRGNRRDQTAITPRRRWFHTGTTARRPKTLIEPLAPVATDITHTAGTIK